MMADITDSDVFASWKAGVKKFVNKVKRGLQRAGSFTMSRSNSTDTTEDDALGLEISSEGESVWSDEDICYPKPLAMPDIENHPRTTKRARRRSKTTFVDIDINAPECYGRRRRRAKTCHVPKVTWSDDDSDMENDLDYSTTEATDLKKKRGHLKRSRSLRDLLCTWGKDVKKKLQQGETNRPSGVQVSFEIGSDDDENLPVVECGVQAKPLQCISLSKDANSFAMHQSQIVARAEA